jgi:dipeptidyl aminopeptidase/acylaminoacyl peptidase
MRRTTWLLIIVARALPAAAQGTRDDYQRAQRFLPANQAGLVLNERVQPTFIGESDRFWYVRELPDGKDFVLVDPVQRVTGPAFDQVRLAAGLAQVLGRPVEARKLPFERFEYAATADAVTLTVDSLLWRCTLAEYRCVRDAAPAAKPPATSPDAKWTAFVREHDLWLRTTESAFEVQLTHDGVFGHAYATPVPNPRLMFAQRTPDPVPETPGVFWSPDSRWLVTYRIDARNARTLSMVQHAPPDAIRPAHYTYWYPLPQDTALPTAELIVFEVGTWRRTAVPMEPIVLQYYGGPTVRWSEDGRFFHVTVADRAYTRRQVRGVDPGTGAVRVMVDEQGRPYVDTSSGLLLEFLAGGNEVLWGSERDGWMHLYLFDAATGSVKRQVTRGEWVVRSIARVDDAARAVFFTAGGKEPGRDPYLQHLYRINLDGSGLRLLTPEDAEHTTTFSPSGNYFVDTHSRADRPAVSVVRRATDGGVVMELERADISRLVALGWKAPEPFKAVARDGKTDIYGIIWRPTTFDASKTYPVVETIYTGPQGFFVPKAFSAWRNHAQTIAELGFVVVQVDGLGTAKRSYAFHSWSYKNLGDQGLEDHMAAIKQIAARYPYMDLARVGIYGHSAGGYDATHALLTHPEFYKVGVSSAGNHDHRLDKAWWNTQWMGWPVGPHYEEQSNVTLAKDLQGKLLLAHGDLDDNVPISATLRLADALIKADKDFDLIVVPNANHGVGSHRYFIRRRWDFFVRHLLGVEPPADFRLAAQGAN